MTHDSPWLPPEVPLAEVVRSPFTESQEARVMLTEGGFSALV
jgi:hypothetical protein